MVYAWMWEMFRPDSIYTIYEIYNYSQIHGTKAPLKIGLLKKVG